MAPARTVGVVLSLVLTLSGCRGPRQQVTSAGSPSAGSPEFTTYALVPVDRLDLSGSRMRDPVSRHYIETVIRRELDAKGLRLDTSGQPSLLVAYFADVFDAPNTRGPVDPEGGGYRWERQGKFTIELIDAATRQVVWHGEGWERDPTRDLSEKVISEVVRRYPD
jgi:hypothetical protein